MKRADLPNRMGSTILTSDSRQAMDYYWPDMCEVEGCAAPMRWRVRADAATYYVCETHRGLPWFDVARTDVDLLRPEEG